MFPKGIIKCIKKKKKRKRLIGFFFFFSICFCLHISRYVVVSRVRVYKKILRLRSPFPYGLRSGLRFFSFIHRPPSLSFFPPFLSPFWFPHGLHVPPSFPAPLGASIACCVCVWGRSQPSFPPPVNASIACWASLAILLHTVYASIACWVCVGVALNHPSPHRSTLQ